MGGRIGWEPILTISWKVGFEIELMAPAGRTRADLAARTSRRLGGTVGRFFHPQSESSAGQTRPVFENLTLGFEAIGPDGRRIAAFVDDLTLQADLDKRAAPRPGWYRIVADDARLLQLVARHCDPSAPLATVLNPLAALFGTEAQPQPAGMVRIVDRRGASVAIGAPLPGERERPCEIVTAPIEADHATVVGGLLADARAEGFGLPREGATHLHFDAAPLRSARVIAAIVALFGAHGAALKRLVGANPHCVRLGPWPPALADLTRSEAFAAMDWPSARSALGTLGLSKYCDFNLLNIVNEDPDKHTFEVRILPAHLTPEPIVEATVLFEAMLRWCSEPQVVARAAPATIEALIQALPMGPADVGLWRARAAAMPR